MSVSVQCQDFDIAAEIAGLRASSGDIGAIVSFTGTVREMTKAGPISGLTLEHYQGMTESELARVEREAMQRWPLGGCRIVHRFGELAPGDNIVLVVTTSAHREAAFEAAAFLMDYLKTSAPFWKKEARKGGAAEWVAANSRDDQAAARWGTTPAAPDKAGPGKADPGKAGPGKADPGKADPGKAGPGKAGPGKAGQ